MVVKIAEINDNKSRRNDWRTPEIVFRELLFHVLGDFVLFLLGALFIGLIIIRYEDDKDSVKRVSEGYVSVFLLFMGIYTLLLDFGGNIYLMYKFFKEGSLPIANKDYRLPEIVEKEISKGFEDEGNSD